MNNYLDKVDLVRFTDRINESFRGRIKYKGTLPIIPTGQTTRGDWSDIAPCYVGHAYVLTGSAEQYIVIDDIRYNVGDLVFATNEVTKDSSGGLSAAVTVQKISGVANPRIDNKTIIENQDPTYSRGGDFMTAVGGWTETSKNQLAAERKLTLDAVATEIKVPAKAYPANGESVMITMVYPSGGSTSESGTYDSYAKKVTTITYYIESDETTSPYITIKNKDASAFAAGSYSVKVSITKATDVESIHTSDPKYIEKDNYTVVIDDLGSVKAKSAIEIDTFPDFALAKTEVLYRLLTNQIISGKQYPAGLYVCDKSDAANPQWVSVGGNNPDEKTIVTHNVMNNLIPMRTAIGGSVERESGSSYASSQIAASATTDVNGEIVNLETTLSKGFWNTVIGAGYVSKEKPYVVKLKNGTSIIWINDIRLIKYPIEKESIANSSFELKNDVFDLTVEYTADGNYKGILNIKSNAGLVASTTYTNIEIYWLIKPVYSYVDNNFIDLDNTTITDINPLDRTAGPLHAKSAIEVATFPTTGILPETIYRLMADVTIEGKKYSKGLYVYDASNPDPVWISVGGSEVDEKTILSTDDNGDPAALHTRVGGWLEDTAYTTGDNGTATTDGQYTFAVTVNPTNVSKCEVGKSVVVYKYTIGTTTGTETLTCESATKFSNATSGSKAEYDGTMLTLFTFKNTAITTGSNIIIDVKFQEEDPEYYKKIHYIDSDYINVDNKTVLRTEVTGGETSIIETQIGGWKELEEGTITSNLPQCKYSFRSSSMDNEINVANFGLDYAWSEVEHMIKTCPKVRITFIHKTAAFPNATATYTNEGITTDNPPRYHFHYDTPDDTGDMYLKPNPDNSNWILMDNFTYDIPGLEDNEEWYMAFTFIDEPDETFHKVKSEYLNVDNISIVNDTRNVSDETGKLHARSAIETEQLSTISNPLEQTIYRLTKDETISGKKYVAGLYVYDRTVTPYAWISVGGSEVDEKTILSTNVDGDLVPLHTKIGGWDETGNIGNLFESCNFVDSYSTGYVHFTSNKNDNIITEENVSYVYIDNSRTGANITYVSGFDTETGPIYDTFNPTKMTFIGGDKTTHIYEYKFEGTDLENRSWTMKIDFANKKIILTTEDTNWPAYGHVVYDDMTFLEYKFDDIKHSVDSDYINIDSKTIIRVNDGEEFDHFETCIGGWKEEGIIDKVDSLGTSWGFGTTSGGMGSSITDTSKFIRGTTFHEGDLLIFEGKFTDGNSNVLTFEYNSSSTTEYKYAFKGVSPLTTSSYIEIYTSSANNEYWSGSFNYPEGTYRTGTAASARAVFNTTVWHKIDSRYLNADNISIYNTNPLDDSLSTLKSRAIITTASVSANNLTTDVIYNLTSSVYYEGKSYKAGLYRYDGTSNLIPITNAAADQKTIVGNVISGDPLHTAVGGYKTTTTEIRYGGLDNYTFIEGPQEVTFPAVSYPENGDQITLYVHTTDGSGSWSRGTYNATTKQATLDNGGMTCYVDKTVSKYWKISFVKGMYVGKTCILDLYRKVTTPEEVLVYSDPHFIDKDNETIVLDNIDKLKAKSAIEISTFPVFALAATEVIYRTTSDQTIEGKSYPKGLYVCDKSDADNPKWISVGMAKLDEKTIRSTNDSGESVPVYTQIGGWKETNYTASIDYGTPLLSEFMYGDNYWDLTFDYTYGTKPSKDTDYIMVDYETADGNQYNGKLTRISIDENNAVYAESTGATPLCRFVNHLNNNTATLYFFANAYGDSLTKSGSISYVSEDIIHHVDSKYINIDNETIVLDADDKIETSIGGVVGEYETKTIAENIKGHAKETTYSFSFIVPDLEETNESNNVQDTYYEIIFKRNSGSEESPSWTRVKFTGYADVSNKIGFNGGYIMKGKIEVLEGSFYQYYFKYWEFVTEQHKIYYHSEYYDVYSDMNKVMLESVKVTKKIGYQNISSEVMNADAVYNNKPYYINIVDVDELPAEPVVGIKYRLKSTGVVQMWSGYGTQKLSDNSSLWSRWYPVAEAIDNATIAYNSYGQIETALGGSYNGSYSSSSIVRSQIEPYRKWVSVGDNYNSFTGFYIQTDYIGYDITKAICNQSSVNFADITIKFTTVDNIEMSETINKVPMTQMYDYGDSYLADYSINGSALSSTTNPYFSKCDQITLHAGGFNKLANISFTCYKSKAEFGIDIEKPIYITYWGISYSTYYNMAKWAMMPLDSGTFKPVYTNAQAPMALNIGGSVDVHTAEIGICYDGVDLTKTDFDDHSELSYQGTGLYLPIDTYYTDQYFNTSLYICYVKGDSTTYIQCYRRADLDYIYQKSSSYKAAVYMYNQTAALDKTNHVVIYHTSTAADRKIVIHIAKDTSTYTFLRLTNAFFTTDKMTNKLIANSIPFNSNTDYINASGEITPIIGGGRKFGSDTHVPCNSSHTNINNRTSASWGDIIPSSINNKTGYFDVWYKFSDGTTQNHKYITLKQENNIYYLAEEGYTDPYAAGIIFNYGEELIEFHTAVGTWPETDVDIVVYTKTIESLEKINNSYVNIDNSTIKVNTEGKLMANYSYGTTLPTSGTEGQVFFLYS